MAGTINYELGRSFFYTLVKSCEKIVYYDSLINRIKWNSRSDFRFGDSCRTINRMLNLMEEKKKWLRIYKVSMSILCEIPTQYREFTKAYIHYVFLKRKEPRISVEKALRDVIKVPIRTIWRRINSVCEFVARKLLQNHKEFTCLVRIVGNEKY